MKKYLIILVLILFVAVPLYHTRKGYKAMIILGNKIPYIGNTLVELVDKTMNQFYFYKIFNKNNLNVDSYIDLFLSIQDIKHMQNKLSSFINSEGFIPDEQNNWRNAKVLINGTKENIEFKFHGTSLSPIKRSISPYDNLKYNIGLSESLIPIRKGGYSLKIKHNKQSSYLNNMRKYNLISSFDDLDITTNVINKLAASIGLISPVGKYVILRINGTIIGSYLLVENHGKEWLEREYGINEFTIMKSNDDWNHKGIGHISDTDLTINDKEIVSTSLNSSIALGKLNDLFYSIKTNNISLIKNLIDVDYFAKYLAFMSITNNSHQITGDNLKYIYDHSTGRFKILFRIEDNLKSNYNTIAKYNNSLYETISPYNGASTHLLFKYLTMDPDFRMLRDKELYKIINDKQLLINLSNSQFDKDKQILIESNQPYRIINYTIEKFYHRLNVNINAANNYLNYNKIYMTSYNNGGKHNVGIINDSFTDVFISINKHNTQIEHSSEKTETVEINNQLTIKAPLLNESFKIIHQEQIIPLNILGKNKVTLINSITNNKIHTRHIYYNKARTQDKLPTPNMVFKNLNENNILWKIDSKSNEILIKKGNYFLKSSLFFPNNYNIRIEKGVTIQIGSKVSLLINGSLFAEGSKSEPIIISSLKDKPFGTFSVIGNGIKKTNVKLNYFKISGGSEAIINGITLSGQMSIHDANVIIDNAQFSNSISDDGLNIKRSLVKIDNSLFLNNLADQLDLDFCQGSINKSKFIIDSAHYIDPNKLTDGIDVSGSKITINNNLITNNTDKGISVGENSTVRIIDNILTMNASAITVKDGSLAKIYLNKFNNNSADISAYIKKKYFDPPRVLISNVLKDLKYDINSKYIVSDSLE